MVGSPKGGGGVVGSPKGGVGGGALTFLAPGCKGHGVFRDTLLFLIGLNLIRKTDRYVGADSLISNHRPSLLPSS